MTHKKRGKTDVLVTIERMMSRKLSFKTYLARALVKASLNRDRDNENSRILLEVRKFTRAIIS